jgi:hypothetical protein
MNRFLARAYLVSGIVALLAVAAVFFWRLDAVRTENEDEAARRFQDLSVQIGSLWQDASLDEAGSRLSELLGPIGSSPPAATAPLVVGVYSFDSGVDYLWAQDGRFLDGLPDPRNSVPEIISNDLVHRRFTRSFELPDGGRRIITAVYPVLTSESTYPVLRDTLAALLGVIALGLTIALIHTILRGRPEGKPEPSAATFATEPGETSGGWADPKDLELGLVAQAGLEHRLTLELERAGYHEQDLSVAFLAFRDIGDRSIAYRNAQAVLSFFTFDDLCFDGGQRKGTQEIVVILPNASLQEALQQIERFQRYYWEERQNWPTPEIDFSCGISSRNGRLVEASRIIGECRAALRRAGETSGRIMGFQPDPQRYRDLVSGHSSR